MHGLLAAGLLATCLMAEEDRIEKRMRAVRATSAELRWRHIPVGLSLVTALKRAKEVNKPVFYFAADGVLDSGNC